MTKSSAKKKTGKSKKQTKEKIRYVDATPEKEEKVMKKVARSKFNQDVMRLLKEYDEEEGG